VGKEENGETRYERERSWNEEDVSKPFKGKPEALATSTAAMKPREAEVEDGSMLRSVELDLYCGEGESKRGGDGRARGVEERGRGR